MIYTETEEAFPEKYLKHEKLDIIYSLNCTDDYNFVINVFKNYDESHLSLTIKRYEELNHDQVEKWIKESIEPSVVTLDLKALKNIYFSEKGALIYIEKPYSGKKYYDNEEANQILERPEDENYNILYEFSLKERNNLLFYRTNENDISTKMLMDLVYFNTEELPIIVGLKAYGYKYSIIKKYISRNVASETRTRIEKFVNNFKLNVNLVKTDYFYLHENEKFNTEENYIFYQAEGYEIYKITEDNFNHEIFERNDKTLFLLFTYKRKINEQVNIIII